MWPFDARITVRLTMKISSLVFRSSLRWSRYAADTRPLAAWSTGKSCLAMTLW